MAVNESLTWLEQLERTPMPDARRLALLRYGEDLAAKGLPVIFGFMHLALLLNIEATELRRILASTNSFYRTFEIPKRKGGTRTPHRIRFC